MFPRNRNVFFETYKCSFFDKLLVEPTFDMVKDNLDFGITLLSPNEKFIYLL